MTFFVGNLKPLFYPCKSAPPRFQDRGVRQPDDGEPRQPGAHVRLHLHRHRVYAEVAEAPCPAHRHASEPSPVAKPGLARHPLPFPS
jgi:hypothetical protein